MSEPPGDEITSVKKGVYRISDGEICFWVDGASMQIKAVAKDGDPVDIGENELEALICALQKCLKEIRE